MQRKNNFNHNNTAKKESNNTKNIVKREAINNYNKNTFNNSSNESSKNKSKFLSKQLVVPEKVVKPKLSLEAKILIKGYKSHLKNNAFKHVTMFRDLERYSIRVKGFTKKYTNLVKLFKLKLRYKNLNIAKRLADRIEMFEKKERKIFLDRNIKTKSYFYRVTHKRLIDASIMIRTDRSKPEFSRRSVVEKQFFISAQEALVKTKRYMYKKQFPKIRGKKNPNFNYAFFNNVKNFSPKFILGRLVITYLHNNTFINIHNNKKMLKVISGGKVGLKGPKRATPYSRQVVMRKAAKFLSIGGIDLLDVYLNSNYSRWYYLMLKELSKPKVKPYQVRYLVISNPRSHGFLRQKKKRRK